MFYILVKKSQSHIVQKKGEYGLPSFHIYWAQLERYLPYELKEMVLIGAYNYSFSNITFLNQAQLRIIPAYLSLAQASCLEFLVLFGRRMRV